MRELCAVARVPTCSIRVTSLIPAPPPSGGLAKTSTHDTNSSADTPRPSPPPPPPPPPLPCPIPRTASLASLALGSPPPAPPSPGLSGQFSTTLTPNTVTPHCLSTPVAKFAQIEEKSGRLKSPFTTAAAAAAAAAAVAVAAAAAASEGGECVPFGTAARNKIAFVGGGTRNTVPGYTVSGRVFEPRHRRRLAYTCVRFLFPVVDDGCGNGRCCKA